MVRAKKSLGQHFLKSEAALRKIRDSANVVGSDIVLEIGPGLGVMTADLLQFAGKVVAIEKDRDLVPHLEEKFRMAIAENKLEILEEDVLDFDPEIMGFYKDFTYKVVANIPYYITGAILEKFLSAQTQPKSMTLLVQKEVAERIVAKPKPANKLRLRQDLNLQPTRQDLNLRGKESILSLSVKAFGTPHIIAKVPAGAFSPAPKVDSAILQIDNISRDFFKECDEALFFKLIKTTFSGKRKQIGGTLQKITGSKEAALAALRQALLDPQTRPEAISLTEWKALTQALAAGKWR
jgi:16S rRNA (adenine1518-N6/adenine1519-N6)-dimethyltransferase